MPHFSLFQILPLVQQNVFVFNDTLYHNVTLYKDFPESDILTAVSEAGLLELIDSHGNEFSCKSFTEYGTIKSSNSERSRQTWKST